MKQPLNEKLKDLRHSNNLSQAELAATLGISRQSISQWERGLSFPDIENLISLCKFYNITIDQLLECDNNFTNKHSQQTETSISNQSTFFSLEFLCLAVLLTLSAQFPFLGIVVPILIIIRQRKFKQKNIFIHILCIFCFVFSLYNTYAMISHIIFDTGTATITPVP